VFSKVLIANRGAIACRIIRTLDRMGVASVAVYSEADRHSLHVARANEAVLLGPAPAAQSYLDAERVLDAARRTGAEAIHPGYGFLSENAAFAEACERAGIAFIGPTPEQMRSFGLKHTARALAAANGVPLLPGTPLLASAAEADLAALDIGLPVMLKSTAGGGGIGMRLCRYMPEVEEAFAAVERTSRASFKDGGIYIEKYVDCARHIEVQIFGDGRGEVIELGERDCSVQRRNQKVVEETPAPHLPQNVRRQLLACAVRLGKAVRYRSAGTVEFVYDADAGKFYFLEVNTRLQVEHGVTEEVTGVDLVEWMVRCAAGEMSSLTELKPSATGHSIQVRIYAEDPGKNFQPSAGLLTEADFPRNARVETGVERGTEVPPFYDPLLAKLIVLGGTRAEALGRLREALAGTSVAGIETNLGYLRQIAVNDSFAQGGVTTRFLDSLPYEARTIEVLDGGTMTTVQDYPGRVGYWQVGVPPSGPMDSLSFRLGNRLLGNEEGAPGLECTLNGPSLRFHFETDFVLAGADFAARLDDVPVAPGMITRAAAGALLELAECARFGVRAYVLVRGGFDVPYYLGSASTFTLGRFGGHAGRALRTGDVLHVSRPKMPALESPPVSLPEFGNAWRIGVLYGPHAAPDFFTEGYIETFFTTCWKVHYNSSRTGVRLIGPKPKWARPDGGDAGLHPSNIHDNAYAIGAIDFTGDMPVILGPDGPSLGGFVCPAVIVDAELWKIGQLRAGDSIRFVPLTLKEAGSLQPGATLPERNLPVEPEIVASIPPGLVCRASGDRYLLIEYGEPVLDLNLRFRVQALLEWLERERPAGIIEATPGIRTLQIHYDSGLLTRAELLTLIERAESSLPDLDDLAIPSRIVHLPLSWDDPATRLAIEKYMKSVRSDAPWCPSNIEFIRRINGLDSTEDVKRIVFDASYLVLGLGDVYLGAPVATPIDPRHRLVTTKYNPARTWTAENSVGIGGAYLCVYGMEGPGGYQFVGRTVQMWNTWRTTPEFCPGSPWLLRFFDQIRFYPVDAAELRELRDAFPHGRFHPKITETQFRLRDYHAFLEETAPETEAFRRNQRAAFDAERERWHETGQDREFERADAAVATPERTVPEGCLAVKSPAHGSVWNVGVKAGERVERGQRLVIVESMKMEIGVATPCDGIVVEVLCGPGAQVGAGESLLFLRPENG
jgi:urea carboxylase